MSCSPFVLPQQGSDEESDRVLVVSDVWENDAVLYKLQQGTFSTSISILEQVQIDHWFVILCLI